MRGLIVLFLLVFSLKSVSQNIEKSIVLKDAESNLPIEDATVFLLKTKQTFLSNTEGKVTFVLNGASNIQVTHASYSGVTVRSSTLKENINIVFLKKNITDLDEVIITKQHPQKILKSIVENSIKKLTVSRSFEGLLS